MTAHSDVSSNAFNFPGFGSSNVDPRTGQYTVSIELPELQGNQLAGPELPLALDFNPLNLLDSGFGLGWNLRLSQYLPDTGMLSLYSGDSFKVTGSGNEPAIRERKLFNFRFFNEGNDTFRIVHASGLVEVLRTAGSQGKRAALPVRIHSPLGHHLDLEYQDFNGAPCLSRVSDASGDLLRIQRDDFSVKIRLAPFADDGGAGEETVFLMRLTGRRVMQVVLPTDEQASWHFAYGLFLGKTCLTEVHTPLGARETIEYGDPGHPFPGKSGRTNLPRVTRHRLYPGFGQPMTEVDYSYTVENFLGNGTSISWADDGLDQLYKVTHTYEYGSTTAYRVGNKVVRTVERTYNRFHLLIEETTRQNRFIKQVTTDYYDENVDFEQQPTRFQLPRCVETRWQLEGDPNRLRVDTSWTEFDDSGNLIAETREDGSRRLYTYYDKAGEDGCPKDPDGFVRSLKESRLMPAEGARSAAPHLVTRYRYQALRALTGAPNNPCLIRSEETTFALRDDEPGREPEREFLNLSQADFFDTPDNPLLHGRRRQVREDLGGGVSTTNFSFTRTRHGLLAEDSLSTTAALSTFDDQQQTLTSHASLHHGETLLGNDANGVEVLRRFDRSRRITHEVVAPGTPVEASREYSYVLAAVHGQQAMQIETDVRGVRTRQRFDGLGRVVATEHWNEQVWQPVYEARFDALGQLVEENRTDWVGDDARTLTTRYEYDDWGEASRTHRPDGVVEVNDTSPFGDGGDLQRTWLESAGEPARVSQVTVTQFNRFDKPDWIERRSSDDEVLSRQVFFYDGYGHCTRQDQELESTTLSTHFEYDARGRMQRTRLPDQTLVERTFAAHSVEELTTTLAVTPGNALDPAVQVGEQHFDGLERLTRRIVGPRLEQYGYEGGRTLVSQRITPAGRTIEYDYEPDLTEQASAIRTQGNDATYRFDRRDARIERTSNAEGNREYEYNAVGHLQLERWTDTGGQAHETRYETSLFGLPQRVEHDGVPTLYDYDGQGRVKRMTQARLQADFEFDDLGRQHRTTTRDLDSGDRLVCENRYDSLGRITLRSLLLNDQPARTISHTWRDDDQLLERHLEMDGRSLLKESFRYDLRGRLEQHLCSGEHLPRDRYGNAIVSQLFLFDALDNIRRCVTQFADGRQDIARFTYATDDPCQLRNVVHSLTEAGYPGSQDFSYDGDGNQLNDDQGQHLQYDSLGRLLKVTSADGKRTVAGYRYDGHQHLLASRQGEEPETLHFYQGHRLSHTVQGTVQTLYFGHEDVPLGQQELNDHERTLLLLTDASPSVIGESLKAAVREAAYTAYGEMQDEQRLQSLMAFNSEPREAASGWYLLGRGYRAYNPSLMRFHSPDSLAPLHEGGINPYSFGLGNPIRFHDPSGHRAARRPGTDLIHTPPVEETKKKKTWVDWLPVIIMGAVAALMIVAIPFAAPVGIGLVMAVAGAGLAVAGVGLAAWGFATDNETLFYIGGAVFTIGTMLGAAGASSARGAYKQQWYSQQAAKGITNPGKPPSPTLIGIIGRQLRGGAGKGGKSGDLTRSPLGREVRSGSGSIPDVQLPRARLNQPDPAIVPADGGRNPASPLAAATPQVPGPTQPVVTSRPGDVRYSDIGKGKLWEHGSTGKISKYLGRIWIRPTPR